MLHGRSQLPNTTYSSKIYLEDCGVFDIGFTPSQKKYNGVLGEMLWFLEMAATDRIQVMLVVACEGS